MFNAQYSMFNAQYSMFNVQYSMFNAQGGGIAFEKNAKRKINKINFAVFQ
jgi:hypothetical protein